MFKLYNEPDWPGVTRVNKAVKIKTQQSRGIHLKSAFSDGI